MADSMMAQILEAEEKAETLKKEAQSKAREIEADGEAKAKRIHEDALRTISELSKAHLLKMSEERDEILSDEQQRSLNDASEYAKTVQKNMNKAVETITKKVEAYGNC